MKIIDSIDKQYKDYLLNPVRLSSFIHEEKYQLLYLRELSPKNDDLHYSVTCFLFKDKKTYHYDFSASDFIEITKKDLLTKTLSSLFLRNRQIVQSFSEEIEHLETDLYSRSIPKHFMDLWFDLRNELSKIDRYNARINQVLHDFYREKSEVDKISDSKFQDVLSKIQYNQFLIKEELSRLDTLHHYYNSLKGDRLNKSLYLLTLISGIFLPLNLVVGFFGMNTENLYFSGNPKGTFYVVTILLSAIGMMFFFIPIFKILDKVILRFVLGRVNLYQNLNKKFDKISDTFKVD